MEQNTARHSTTDVVTAQRNKRRQTLMFKRFASVVLLTSLFAVSQVGVASAHPSAAAQAHHTSKVWSGVGIIEVRLPGSHTHVLRPKGACAAYQWVTRDTGRVDHANWVSEAILWVLVDSNNPSIYCGEVEAKGRPRLLQGCAEFSGEAANGWSGFVG